MNPLSINAYICPEDMPVEALFPLAVAAGATAIERRCADANTNLSGAGLRNGYIAQLEQHRIVDRTDPP
jgi:hypothetical protein